MKQKFLWMLFPFFLVNHTSAQIKGCTDPLAVNYNVDANINDGSCTYSSISLSPISSFHLDSSLKETSGLIQWNNQIWTHNDDNDINLYALDTLNGRIIESYPLTGTENQDWEEIAQDSHYIYIGDFGNNVSGNRTDLKILRIGKSSILAQKPLIDTIFFSYSNQNDLTPQRANRTDFDCEAFVVSGDSIFLFTKQWLSNQSSVYVLPKIPGSYIARLQSTFDVDGLITGAILMEPERLLALSGYSSLLQPFVYLLYDFAGSDFFNGNKRKVSLSLPFHQIEGITTTNGFKFYLSNEYFSKPPLNDIPQQLHIFDLSDLLDGYLNGPASTVSNQQTEPDISIYPNPAKDFLTIDASGPPADYEMTNVMGKVVMRGRLSQRISKIYLEGIASGLYFLTIKAQAGERCFVVVKK